MTSKADILARIRRNRPADAPLPELNDDWITFPDRQAQLLDVLESVGGHGHVVGAGETLADAVGRLPCLADAQKIVCTISELAGAVGANCNLHEVADPHDLADVDVAILPGQFAVAENAAVWVSDRGLPHRAIYFIPQHLVLVVPPGEIVDNLHEAYRRVQFDGPGYGLFISGPSKTADIEQSLVIGAHGPRSLSVILQQASPEKT